jgi:hypothetical protein
LYRQHAAQIERQNHEDRHHIGAHAAGRKQDDGAGEHAKDNQNLLCHGRALVLETAFAFNRHSPGSRPFRGPGSRI